MGGRMVTLALALWGCKPDDTDGPLDTDVVDTDTDVVDTDTDVVDTDTVDTDTDPPVPAACGDGVDNDGDGAVDWQLDLGCTGPGDDTEGGLTAALDGGWTVFEPSPDTTVIYVSSSLGNDAWTGSSPEPMGEDGPLKTVAAALARVTDGEPDWVLFRRGDVWVDETLGSFELGGRSEDEPVVVASYGPSVERPRFDVASASFVRFFPGDDTTRSHIAILGLHVAIVGKDPDDPRFNGQGGVCVQWYREGGDVLFEDFRCDYGGMNLINNPTLPFTIRRSVLYGSYSLNSHAQNLFTSIHAPLLVEESILIHGGWNEVFRLALWAPSGDVSAWNVIADGRFSVTLDAVRYEFDSVDFTAATDMDGVAEALEAAINAEVGAEVVSLRFTDGGAFQLRAPSLPSDSDYAIGASSGAVDGTDLDSLFGLASQGVPESTVFNRNMYLSHGFGNGVVRGNIDAVGASGGVQLRMGGIVEDNLFVSDPVSITVGHQENDADHIVTGSIINNVVLGASDIDTQTQGTGIWLSSHATVASGAGASLVEDFEISGNIVAHNVRGTGNIQAIKLGGSGTLTDVRVFDNIVYDWAMPVWPNPNDQRARALSLEFAAGSDISVHDNVFQQPNGGFLARAPTVTTGLTIADNAYWSAAPNPPDVWSRGWFEIGDAITVENWASRTGDSGMVLEPVSFVDADRTIEAYMAMHGEAPTEEAFLEAAMGQSRLTWRDEWTAASVNAWVREGFQRAP